MCENIVPYAEMLLWMRKKRAEEIAIPIQMK